MRKRALMAFAAAGLLAAAVPAGSALAAPQGSGGPLTLAVYGDSPYGVAAYPPGGQAGDTAELQKAPAFIGAINADSSVSEVIHVGDIHSGKDFCTEAYDNQIAALWQQYQEPLVYTPGDNEWSDCHKATSLAKPGEGGGLYKSGVLNYIGTSGLTTDPAACADYHAKGVVIATQADMWDLDGKTPAHLTNYEPIISTIASLTTAFARPALLFNGDSHLYRSDNPLSPTAPCTGETDPATGMSVCAHDPGNTAWSEHPFYNVANFHRVVVHGSTLPLEWLKLTIDPNANYKATATTFGPFTWQRMPQPER